MPRFGEIQVTRNFEVAYRTNHSPVCAANSWDLVSHLWISNERRCGSAQVLTAPSRVASDIDTLVDLCSGTNHRSFGLEHASLSAWM
jgi:hypothetical protein